MNIKFWLLILGIFILINAGLFLLLNKDNLTSQINQTGPSNNKITDPSRVEVSLPVDPSHPAVERVIFSYEFRGIVTALEPQGGNVIIQLDSSTPGLPEFLTTNETDVFRISGDSSVPVAVSDIQVGQDISILMSYNEDVGWNMDMIIINQANSQ